MPESISIDSLIAGLEQRLQQAKLPTFHKAEIDYSLDMVKKEVAHMQRELATQRERISQMMGRPAGVEAEPKVTRFIVNGEPKYTHRNILEYGEVLLAAGLWDGEGEPPVISVCYAFPPGVDRRDGILSRGKSVDVVPGMVFNACHTSNA